MDKTQAQIFTKMSAEKKLELSLRLYYSARRLKAAHLRNLHPDWSEEKIQEEVRRIFLYART